MKTTILFIFIILIFAMIIQIHLSKKNNKYLIQSNKNNSYNIEIFIDSNFLLNINIIKTIDEIIYNNKFSLDDIKAKNKYFLICNTISDAFTILESKFKNKDNIKLLEEDNEFIISINIPNPLSPQIDFNIKKIMINSSINDLYKLINQQIIRINLLEETIENQQKKLNEQENKINKLDEEIKKLQKNKFINKDNNIKINNKTLLIDNSNIIRNDKEKEEKIREWINPKKNISFTLLYRMTRDGLNVEDFHKNCDNQGPTLVLIETNKNYKFGGYTPLDWESPLYYMNKNDEETFLFSLNLMKKYKKIEEGRSIYLSKEYGPCFGQGSDIGIGSKKMNQGYVRNTNYMVDYEVTYGDSYFECKEVEVFKVEFD